MSDTPSNTGSVPPAPYPPLVSTRIEKGRERSRSISQIASSFAAISSPSGGTSSSNNATNVPKRRLPARVEFYDSTVYGAINCLGHNTFDSGGDGHENRSNVRSSQTTNTLSRMNKLGPVLLELRCLHPRKMKNENPTQDGDKDNDYNEYGRDDSQQNRKSSSVFSFYEGRTLALCRGNASLGIGVSSTSLSFRKGGNSFLSINGDDSSSNLDEEKVFCATGLSSGALCIHTVKNLEEYARIQMEEEKEEEADGRRHYPKTILDSANSDEASVSYFFHRQPRHNRSASAVAWKCGSRGSNSSHVAIGYNPTSGDRFTPGKRSPSTMQSHGGFSGKGECCALVWDVEAQSAPAKGKLQEPTHKYAHNSSVTSLNWISDGKLLAVGCQHRNLQIYDLISAGPISVFAAHERSVNGIEVDPHNSNVFATFSRGLAEPVKIWDRRRADSCVAEIKTHGAQTWGDGKELQTFVSGIAWENSSEGILCIAKGDELRSYNTKISPSRPILTNITHSDEPLQCISFPLHGKTLMKTKSAFNDVIPQRILAVCTDDTVTDLPTKQLSPLSLSNRDGRVANALGSQLYIGNPSNGPSTTKRPTYSPFEDVSITMVRRARSLHNKRYSTDAASNLEMLTSEKEAFLAEKEGDIGSNHELVHLRLLENLYSVWSWIERVENLCFVPGTGIDSGIVDERFWTAKSLCDAGVLRLLRLDEADIDDFETFSKSEVFDRNIYDSPSRRVALTACGWTGRYRLKDVLFDTESSGNFERSAALACWHGELGEAVAALQRGADHIRAQMTHHTETENNGLLTSQYAETLELVAMCVAGYNSGGERNSHSAIVWRNACQNLLNRPNLNETRNPGSRSHLNYLRAICSFLIDDNDHDKTLRDASLNLSDRVAFACIYLSRKQLKEYLETSVEDCLRSGNLEGLLITGLKKKGIALLQSYVDSRSDVQTAALISSRAIFPPGAGWAKVCIEWLSSYREFLNKNQMWKSRAIFDVGRADLIRKLRDHKLRDHKQQTEQQFVQNVATMGRVQVLRKATNHSRKQQHTQLTSRQNESPITSFPPQIYARCNFCNTSLPLAKLRRQENIANNWLSRQKPVLPCCPNPVCRKPLPQCAICLLPLNCLNPFMELRREGNRLNRGPHGQQRGGEDLSGLASMPFAQWFTWCAKCNHGGHAHHYVSWFDNHDVCPVSNCDCRCQFDTTQKFTCFRAMNEEEKI